jgi:hypothetical protein
MSNASNPTQGSCGVDPVALCNGKFQYACGEVPGASYLFPQDIINFALPTRTVHDIGVDILWRRCIAVSSEFRGYARKRYRMPLIAWGASVVERLAFRAAGGALRQRGYSEEGNEQIKEAYEESGQWMADVRDYKIDPDIIESQPQINTPRASSMPLRGWWGGL